MKAFTLVIFLFTNLIGFSQNIYEKHDGEKNDAFLSRVFPQFQFSQVVSGNWGDTTARLKVIGFYTDTVDYFQKAIILQNLYGNKFQPLKMTHPFGIGVTTSTIMSVFFYDIDKNGTRELIVVEAGTGRCHDELEEYDEETKKTSKIPIVVACDICGYSIFEQKIKSLVVNTVEINQDSYPGNCDYKSVKEFLMKKK